MAAAAGAAKPLELDTTLLGREELKEKDCGAGVGVSNAENLSFRFDFTVSVEGVVILWGVGAGAGAGVEAGVGVGAGAGAGAATADGLMEGVLKENADGAEGVSEGGLEAKEKLEDPDPTDPKGVVPPRENTEGAEVAQVDGTEKVKPDDDDDTGTVGTMLNGAAEEEAAGAGGVEAAAEVRPRFANAAGVDGVEAAALGSWVAKEPGLGSLSPSKARGLGAETSCLTPGLRLRRANGQSNPSVDSISIVGTGGTVFSSVMWISCWLV